MFSLKLRDKNIQKKIRELSNLPSESIVENQKIRSVGILSQENTSNFFQLQELATEILEIRNPRIYTYRKFDKDDEKSYKHFTEKDFNWNGEITDTSLKSFIDHPFDLLICFYDKKNKYLEYLTLLSKASFKLGFAKVYSKPLDLEIAVDISQANDFFEEAKKYLTILKKL